jgi:hypothetical protein
VNVKLLFLISLAGTPLFILLLQMVFSRLINGARRSPQITVAGCSVVVFFLILIMWWKPLYLDLRMPLPDRILFAAYTLIVYLSLSLTYFHVFNMSETARRIRILYEVYSKGRISRAELRDKYGLHQMIKVRLKRLVSTGQIKYSDGRYVLSGRLLYYAARAVMFWRSVIFPK